jgi:hypothetical protein
MSSKKTIVLGFLFGALSAPISILGLGSEFFYYLFYPIIFIPKLIINLFPIQSMSGMAPVLLMMLVSGALYAFVGAGLRYVYYQIRS